MPSNGETVCSSERRHFRECYPAGIMEDDDSLQQAYKLCMSDLILEKWKPELENTDGYPVIKATVAHRSKLKPIESIRNIKHEVSYSSIFL